jgi:hypothetical protein
MSAYDPKLTSEAIGPKIDKAMLPIVFLMRGVRQL